MKDSNARHAIATALDDTFVVEAAAGTGKTTELVNRIVRILASGRAAVQGIVAVTFTEKAAGELKLRLREALDVARTNAAPDERDALNRALQSLEEAHVSTIHGFCAELLRERPVEARVDPLFSVLTESQAERIFDQAFGAWIQAQLQDPPEGVRRGLRRSIWQGFGSVAREDTPIDRLRRAAWELAQWRDFDGAWTRPVFDREGDIDRLVEKLREFADLIDGPSYAKDTLYLDTAAARHLSAEIAMQQSFRESFRLKAEATGFDAEATGSDAEGRASDAEARGSGGRAEATVDRPGPGGFRLQAEDQPGPGGVRLQAEDQPGPGGVRVQAEDQPGPGGFRLQAEDQAKDRAHGLADYDGWEARLVDLSRDRNFAKVRHGRGPGYKPAVTRQRVIDAYDELKPMLDRFRLDADADLAAALQHELSGAISRYEELKARAGALDFLDLLLKARDLVRGNADVRRGFQARFTHIFVDEFQDTDPLQAEILLLLASADPEQDDWREVVPVPGRLFIVGDPKQSIYRFRRADVRIYRDVCERLVGAGAKPLELTTSFRSVPQIQACVNAAFAPLMTGDAATLQAAYVPLSPDRPDIKGQPAVVALPVPEPYGVRNLSAVRIEQSLPDAIGAFVEWIVTGSGWKVSGRGEKNTPVETRDICILFRRFMSFGEDMTQPYVRALEARGVRHVLVGGKSFHDREEVETLRAALAAIEWPDDELAVFAALRGALFSIGDEELLEWKQRYGIFHPFRIPAGDFPVTSDPSQPPGSIFQPPTFDLRHLAPIAGALRVLQRLHRRRNYRPVAETIQDLLDTTRAHVGIVLRSAGEQALANVLHVAELAREYEAGGGLSFRGFVDELRVAAGTAQAGEAPILEEGSDGVRMMTVHKAKGLEFPIVILADLTCKLSRAEAGRWLDPAHNVCALKIGGWAPIDLLLHDAEEAARDRAESQRLTYVAATRARDVLVVPAVGDGPYDGGWLDPLVPAIYPPEGARRDPRRTPGVPDFTSKDSVLRRPDGDPASPKTVAPGTFEFHPEAQSAKTRAYSVTWWDPRALRLGAVSSFGLRRDDLIVKDGDMFAVEDRLADYEKWRAERERIVALGARPSVRFQTATAWAAEAAKLGIDEGLLAQTDAAPIEVVQIAGAQDRPRGARFGTLVHAVLATVPLDATGDRIARTAGTQGRVINASAEEVAAAEIVVSAVMRHPLMTRARASASVKRETPVAWVQRDGMLIEGVLDLAFDEGDATVVVDFKTDYELAAGETRYRAQLQQYAHAVTRATGRAASGVLFKV
ncbi:MAG TPA: UvrD-helicase domain-containing protein [Vicinamibacterales bacterium]|nr:UvrD-helicase domain-containing protein [Vicinamibacterales bacterium]